MNIINTNYYNNKTEQNKIHLAPTHSGHTVNNCFITEQVNELIGTVPKPKLRTKWQTSVYYSTAEYNMRTMLRTLR